MKALISIFLFLLFQGCSEGSESKPSKRVSYLPENQLHLIDPNPVPLEGATTQAQFNAILERAKRIYSPIIEQHGGYLSVNGDWSNNTVNAYAEQNGRNWSVSFYGGLAKRVTPDGFAIVVCHELGHHLGYGVLYPNNSWKAAVEGQSDYWATAVCARKMFDPANDDEETPTEEGEPPCGFLPPYQSDMIEGFKCASEVGADKTICQRSLDGGLSLGRLLANLGGEPEPSYNNLDRSKVSKTQYSHPKAACRLTSYYGGVMCSKSWPDNFAPMNIKEAKQYQCTEYLTCWLNEKNL
jgi:hypothetical protein